MTRHRTLLYLLTFTLICVISFWRFGSHPVVQNVIKSISDCSVIPHRVELEVLDGLPQNNSFLISYLRQHHLFPPSTRPYRYSKLYGHRVAYINESRETTRIILSYLKNKTNGVFVEAGANNGADEISNTLVLERDYNWTGLLVEGSPLVFPKLMAAHRKSWKSDVLLSKYSKTQLSIFKQWRNIYAGKEVRKNIWDPVAVMDTDGKTPLLSFEVLSVPLYSLIAACKYDVIDYLSLDVEGTEMEILMNFPFDKVLIRTMIVEVNVLGQSKTKRLIDFLSSKGFQKHPVGPTPRDMLFIHKSVVENQRGYH